MVAVSPILAYGYSSKVEPNWLSVTKVNLDPKGITVAHISDIHYLGERKRFEDVINRIYDNNCKYVLFTGDLTDHYGHEYLDEALSIISGIHIPVYGVPGNHDLSGEKNNQRYKLAFRKTGGDWLLNQSVSLPEFDLYGTSSKRLVPNRLDESKKAYYLLIIQKQ